MSGHNEQLDPTRLCEIADIALRASIEVAEYTETAVRPYPADLLGGPLQPDALAPFTRFEIESASAFLWRLGEVAAPTGTRDAA